MNCFSERRTPGSKAVRPGVRVEHPQGIIDAAQYHSPVRSNWLPPASYSLTCQVDDRGVYSFACARWDHRTGRHPQGEVVVNGWSPSKRNNPYANSGMVVSVGLADFLPGDAAGDCRACDFKPKLEQQAFRAGGGNCGACPAPDRISRTQGKSRSARLLLLTGNSSGKARRSITTTVSSALREGLKQFEKKMKAYFMNEAVLVATESRTFCPCGIPRDRETLMHPQIAGLFPSRRSGICRWNRVSGHGR